MFDSLRTHDDIQTLRGSLEAIVTRAKAAIESRRKHIADLRADLVRAKGSGVPLSEVETRLRALVAVTGRQWLDDRGSDLVQGRNALTYHALEGAGMLPWDHAEALPWGAVCAAEPDRAVAFVMALIRQVPYDVGTRADERPALIDRLTRDLADAEAREEADVDAAQTAGVDIAHRPEVLTRRASEAERRARDERRAAEQLERQGVVNDEAAVHVRRSRVGESDYLRRVREGLPPVTGDRTA